MATPYTQQQNGVAKRRNRTLLNMVWFIMAQGNLIISFLGDALLSVAYIINWVPSKLVPFHTLRAMDLQQEQFEIFFAMGLSGICVHYFPLKWEVCLRGIFICYSNHSKVCVFLKGMKMEVWLRQVMRCEFSWREISYQRRSKPEFGLVWARWECTNFPSWVRGFWAYTSWEHWELHLAQGGACMVAPHDSLGPRPVKEALSVPNSRELIDAMKDEMEPMQTNQV